MNISGRQQPLDRGGRWRAGLGLAYLGLALGLVLLSYWLDADQALIIAQRHRAELQSWASQQPLAAQLAYFLCYVLFGLLALPAAFILTMIGGAVFGPGQGVLLSSFGSTAGATLAFLASRYLLRQWVLRRYGTRWQRVQSELEAGGSYYLLSLRLNPLIPFSMVNLLFGLSSMSVWRFWVCSQVGMLPAAFVYTTAGAHLAKVHSLRDLASWPIIASLLGLSVFPIIARWIAARLHSSKAPTPVVPSAPPLLGVDKSPRDNTISQDPSGV